MVEFRILGPLDVRESDRSLLPNRRKARLLLAVLLLRANTLTSTDELVDLLWDGQPPASAIANLQTYLTDIRRLLPDRVSTRLGSYTLRAEPDELDAITFDRLAAKGRQALASGDHAVALGHLTRALGLWHGRVLDDLVLPDPLLPQVTRLEEMRLVGLEDSIDARLGVAGHCELVAELEALTARHPLRERFWSQLMLALYRSGRQAEALDAYRRLRELLVDDLGVEPGPAVRELHRQILAADRALDLQVAVESRAALPAPRQLPADVGDFIGRDAHLDELDSLLPADDRPTAVVITAIAGTAGVGKTALAVHWAHRVADRFPDGQIYVNLRGYAPTPPLRPVEALAHLLAALGVATEKIPAEAEQASALYRSLLAGKRVLVVLDNAAAADQVRPLLPGSPGCLVVVTSRDRLGGLVARDGARRLSVDMLAADEARTLLARILGPKRAVAEPEAVAELARLCVYLPLALRIAAANLVNDPHQTVAGYVAELTTVDRLAALRVEGDEQGAVQAAFDLSYQRLPAEAQRLFRLLGLVPGPDFTPDAVAALAEIPVSSTRPLLDQLAGGHLIDHHASGRYRLHDLLRAYAGRHAEADPDHELAAWRLYDWYLRTTDLAARRLYPEKLRLPAPADDADQPEIEIDESDPLEWLENERPNLVAAVRHGPPPQSWLIADALRGYFWLRRHTVDWLTVAESSLAAARAHDDPPGQLAAMLSLADVHRCIGHNDRAVEHHRAALELARKLGWRDGIATILNNLAGVCIELGRLDQAQQYAVESLTLYRTAGMDLREGLALSTLGNVCRHRGQLTEALEHMTKALSLMRRLGSQQGEGADLDSLAAILCDLGRTDEALAAATGSVALFQQLGSHRDEPEARNTCGMIRCRLGQFQLAIDQHEQAYSFARETDNRFVEAAALMGIATACRHLAQIDKATDHAQEALSLARAGGYGLIVGRALTELAAVHLAEGRYDRATERADEALTNHRQTGDRLGEARTLVVLGQVAAAAGQRDAARRRWREALGIFGFCGAGPEAEQVRLLLNG